MENDFRLKMKFWGVRGSTPTPRIENLNYGGNTPCVSVQLPNDEIFIFDAGTGVRNLGTELVEQFPDQALHLRLFLTHFHWDHIQGIPFFPPLYRPEDRVTFYSLHFNGHEEEGGPIGSLEATLKVQMADPFFPISLEHMSAHKEFAEIDPEPLKFGELQIHPFPLNHPGRAFGFRIEHQGAVIVYATDLEHGHEKLDRVLRDFSQGADLLIYDSQYTPEDYPEHKDWGHSTWSEACRVARDSRVKQLALFHHNPDYTDKVFFQIVQQARRDFENTLGAREGLSVIL